MSCPHPDVEYCRCDERVVSDDEWESMEAERDRYKAALEHIAKIGCMQSKDEEEFFCKHDGSAHSCYCPEGIARRALRGEQGEP